MATTPVTTSTSATSSSSSSNVAQAQKRLNTNYQDFLKLLTTQLQHQDPTAPADTNQLTQQIASLSQVEQQINTNTLLEKLVATMSATQVNNALAYIGKQVDTKSDAVSLTKGAAVLMYDLPAGAQDVTVNILNNAGGTVYSTAGTKVAGRNTIAWDGTNSVTGQTMPDGVYKIKISAKDGSGKALSATTYTTGVVTAVNTKDGANTLAIGDLAVPMADVQSIYPPVALTAAAQ